MGKADEFFVKLQKFKHFSLLSSEVWFCHKITSFQRDFSLESAGKELVDEVLLTFSGNFRGFAY